MFILFDFLPVFDRRNMCIFIFITPPTKAARGLKRSRDLNLMIKIPKRLFFIGCGIFLIVEIIFALLTDFEPVADLHNIKRYAMYFSTHGNFNLIEQDYARDYQYLVRYPNNMALLLIVSLVGRLNYLIFGHYVDFAPVVVNYFWRLTFQ